MRYIAMLLSILLFAGCHPQTPAPVAPKPPVQKPHFEPETPQESAKAPGPGPVKRDPEMLRETEEWLVILIAHLDMNLEEAMAFCNKVFDEQLTPLKDRDHWFECGGPEGYTVVINDDGDIFYVADANHEGWTLPILRELLGREDSVSDNATLVEHHWVKSPADGGPDLGISFNVPKDLKNSRPFVSLKYSETSETSEAPKKPVKSGASLTL